MSFEAHAPNIQNLQDYLEGEKKKQSAPSDGIRWWSIPKGMSSIRILPPWDPSGRIALAVNMHPIEYQTPEMKWKKYNWTCLNHTFNKPCKICEGLAELSAAGVDISKYEANRRQFYMNAIVMYDPRYQASIQAGKKPEDAEGTAPGTHVVLKAPKTLYDWVIAQITNPMVGDITSLTNGIDVYVTKEGEGLGTKYTPTLSPNGRTPVPQEYLDKIESLYNLDEIFSTGFDEKMIEGLISSLKKSAGVIASSIPGVVNQMAGYQTVQQSTPQFTPAQSYPTQPVMAPNNYSQVPTVQPYQAPSTTGTPAPNPYMTQAQQAPVAPSPFVAQQPQQGAAPWQKPAAEVYAAPVAPTPLVQSQPASQSNQSPQNMNLPKCFGQYNPQQVTCVVCPAEIPCSQKTAGR